MFNPQTIYHIAQTVDKGINVAGKIEHISAPFTLDCGAEANCINSSFFHANKAGFPEFTFYDPRIELLDINNNKLQIQGVIKINISIGGHTWQDEVFVVDDLPVDFLLGYPTMRKEQLDLLNSEDCLQGRTANGSIFRVPYLGRSTAEGGRAPSTHSQFAIHLNEDVWIPAGCERLVRCVASRMKSQEDTLTMQVDGIDNVKHPSIHMARGICLVVKGESTVAISNFGVLPEKVGRGTIIGLGTVIDSPESILATPIGDLADVPSSVESRRINMLSASSSEGTGQLKALKEDIEAVKKEFNLPDEIEIGIQDLSQEQLVLLGKLLKEYRSLFANDPANPGKVPASVALHDIDVGEAKPINQGPRRVSPAQRKVIKETIETLLASGIISPSRSPWASPVLLVPKGDGFRMCIDYRRLNEVTRKEIYALPRIDDVLDTLTGKMYFTTLDLASGYFQIGMHPDSRAKTAFVTYDGQYEYNVMSFGLVNAPSTFQRCMDTVLAGLKWSSVQVYLDDVIIASTSFAQHLKDIDAVFTRFKEAGLKLKASKCHFCCSEVEYLGHLVTRDGVKPNPSKVDLIANWGVPTSASNLHSFLGLAGYYRRLINKFAAREAPLRAILRKDATFHMGPVELAAFRDLQQCLMSDPIIALPDFSGNSKFELHTDASDLGISAILAQIGPDNKERVIQYASRMLTKSELKWHTQEKEALAIVWGCNKFRTYLIGTPFIVRTDHHSLQWLFQSEKGRLARWALSLSEFDYTIKHRPGKVNMNADVASRWTKTPPDDNWYPFPSHSYPPSQNVPENKAIHKVLMFTV